MEIGIFDSIIILLTIAVIMHALFKFLNLPSILGYLVVGILAGPPALGLISEPRMATELAEFGIVFLMFTIGLEFSLSQLFAMKKIVFLYGGLQVALSIIITLFIGKLFQMTFIEAMVVGCIVAMSSTAIVAKQLSEQLELSSVHGTDAIGILLFQDIAVIMLLVILPSLARVSDQLAYHLLFEAFKGVAAVVAILLIGHWVLRPLFYRIAATNSLEIFTLMVLLVTLGAAWGTHKIGLSMSLGSFIAGIMLGETAFRHQIENDIRPFRDVLMGLFFITIGMQLVPSTLIHAWQWLLLMLIALLLLKTLIVFGLIYLERREPVTSLRTAIILAQGGEFGFALLNTALRHKLIPVEYGQVVLGSLVLTMAIAPLLIRYNGRIVRLIFPEQNKAEESDREQSVQELSQQMSNHVIICGYGHVGQNVANIIELMGFKYIALDLDIDRIGEAEIAGDNVRYADGTHFHILKAAGIDRAKALIISFRDQRIAKIIISQVRQYFQHLPIIVRSHDDCSSRILYDMGATEVVPEAQEAAIMIATHVLLMMGVAVEKVYGLLRQCREQHYDLLNRIYPGHDEMYPGASVNLDRAMHTVIIKEEAHAVGRTINELDLENKLNISVIRIRRKTARYTNPAETMKIESGDIVVLFGEMNNLELAEDLLLKG